MDTVFRIDYGGMNAGMIAAWLLIATFVGFFARRLVSGRKIIGLWGDAVIGFVGCFLIGTVLRALNVDLTRITTSWLPAEWQHLGVWVDIVLSSLAGALLIRLALKPFTGGPKKHAPAKAH